MLCQEIETRPKIRGEDYAVVYVFAYELLFLIKRS